MARKKSGMKGLLFLGVAGLLGAYFHEKITPYIDQAKAALNIKA
jgi:hypothetical protein